MIPKIIHQVWIGGDMPDPMASWSRRWQELHPEWQYYLWDESILTVTADLAERAKREMHRRLWPSALSDLIRFEVLWHYGGVYIDVDNEPLKPLDPLMEIGRGFMGLETCNRIASDILGLEALHPLAAALIEGARTSAGRFLSLADADICHLWGPDFVRKVAASMPNKCGIVIYPWFILHPYTRHEYDTTQVSKHHPEAFVANHHVPAMSWWNTAKGEVPKEYVA